MKSTFSLLVFLFFFSSFYAQSDSATYLVNSPEPFQRPQNNIFIQPLDFVVGGFTVGYERFFEKTALKVLSGYFVNENPTIYNNATDLEGVRTEVQFKMFYRNDNKNESHSFDPYLAGYALFKYGSMTENTDDFFDYPSASYIEPYDVESAALGIGIYFGMQFFSLSGFTADAYLGGGVYIPTNNSGADELHLPVLNPYKRSIGPRCSFTIGYSF